VLVFTSVPALQQDLKNTGKNPAITVVAKAELAQSYRAHPQTSFDLLMGILNRESGCGDTGTPMIGDQYRMNSFYRKPVDPLLRKFALGTIVCENHLNIRKET
jgi:hypothetical protein